MTSQLSFDLPVRPALGRADFFISGSNALAIATLDNWRDWPGGKLALTGETGSGKTHLAHVWASECGALVYDARDLSPDTDIEALSRQSVALEHTDDIAGDEIRENLVFHLHNLLLANGQALLITGRSEPALWPLRLPDLKSRMAGTPAVRLEAPDDALLMQVMAKQFSDRGIVVNPSVLPYLASRMDRSFAAVSTLVQVLDKEALSRGKPVGQRLAGEVLDKIAQSDA